jgi:hypothetical protein
VAQLVAGLRHAGCVLLGALVALAAVGVHRSLLPLGLLLALSTTGAVPWWQLRSPWPRTAASYCVGWLGMFAVVVAGRPEGDYALAGDLPGYALMAAGFLLVVVGVVALAGGSRRRADS